MRNRNTKKLSVSIIVPVMGRFDLLKQCLDSIPKACQRNEYEIIIVDNSSPKEEAKNFYSENSDFFLIKNQINKGFPFACNQGASKSDAHLLFFLNSDIILKENSIDIMIEEMNKDQTIGISGMLLLFPDYVEGLNPNIRPSGKVQHAGMDTNIHGQWIHTFVGWDSDSPKVLSQRDCYAVTGAALMIRRNIFQRVGSFDLHYGLGTYEDVDLCMKVRELGYNIIVNTNAVGIHYTSATAESYRIPFPLDQNRLYFLNKWASKIVWTEYLRW